jgi:two-component system cell cycle response regulator
MAGNRQHIFDVTTFGISDSELEVLRRIFVVSADRPNTYRLLPDGSNSRKPRIMMLDREIPSNVYQWANAHKGLANQPSTVILTQNEPEDGKLSLRRPLIATRVLAVLDRAVKALEGTDATTVASDLNAFESTDVELEPGKQYRALVVDDSLTVRKQIAAALDKVNVEASFAENGEQALTRLERPNYHIIFLDVIMPGIDGYDVCKRIKRDPKTKHIPVVLLTGCSTRLDRVKGKMSGCDAYLVKPVSKDEFYQTLRKRMAK